MNVKTKKFLLSLIFERKKSGRRVIGIIPWLIVGYCLMIAIMYYRQRDFLYYPQHNLYSPAAYGVADMEVVEIRTDDGLTLKGWYKAPADPLRPVIVMFHGNAGHIGYRGFKARLMIDAGYGFLLTEYRGYGGNPGRPSEDAFYQDAMPWMKLLEARGIPPERTVLYGESVGTGPAVQVAMKYPGIRALVLETPFTNLGTVAQKHFFYLPANLLLRDRFDNINKIKKIHAPVLVLHGTADTIVPYSDGQALFAAANEPKTMETFPMGGHNDLFMHGAGLRMLRFLEYLDKPGVLMQNVPQEN